MHYIFLLLAFTSLGVPVPKLEWYKDAVPLSKLNNPRYKVISSMGLQIRKLHPSDAGIFQCFAMNAAGETQVHTYLDVTSESEAKQGEICIPGLPSVRKARSVWP